MNEFEMYVQLILINELICNLENFKSVKDSLKNFKIEQISGEHLMS